MLLGLGIVPGVILLDLCFGVSIGPRVRCKSEILVCSLVGRGDLSLASTLSVDIRV